MRRIKNASRGVCHDCIYGYKCMDSDRGIACTQYDGPVLWERRQKEKEREACS